MKNNDRIEALAKACGFQTRRENIRSLEVVRIFDEGSSAWITFDPIFQGKDVAKMLYKLACTTEGFVGDEVSFRSHMVDWVLEEVNGKEDSVS